MSLLANSETLIIISITIFQILHLYRCQGDSKIYEEFVKLINNYIYTPSGQVTTLPSLVTCPFTLVLELLPKPVLRPSFPTSFGHLESSLNIYIVEKLLPEFVFNLVVIYILCFLFE